LPLFQRVHQQVPLVVLQWHAIAMDGRRRRWSLVRRRAIRGRAVARLGVAIAVNDLPHLLEKGPRQTGLSNDAQQRACSNGVVKRDRDRDGRTFCPLLHHKVTTALADRDEAMLFENLADLPARKNSKPAQP
jgi:hypothetical protein